eukprot:7850965-Pyramimonas_sp.AAC.1
MDVSKPRAQRHIIKGLLRRGLVWYLHLGTPCTTWSRARTTGSSSAVLGGLQLAKFTLDLIKLCKRYGVLYSLENPRSSRLFTWEPLRKELQIQNAIFVRYDN